MQKPIYCPACRRIDMAAWLRTKGVYLGPAGAQQLNELLDPHNPPPRNAEGIPGPLSTFRFRMRKKGLPGAGRWVTLARALRVARLAQEHPTASVETLALWSGYADASGARHLLRKTFDLTVGQLRERHYPIEELLDRWWGHSCRPEATDAERAA